MEFSKIFTIFFVVNWHFIETNLIFRILTLFSRILYEIREELVA